MKISSGPVHFFPFLLLIQVGLIPLAWGDYERKQESALQRHSLDPSPMLRIDDFDNVGLSDSTGKNNLITAMDRDRKLLLAAGKNKTLRLWEVATGRLLRTFYPPIGQGGEGRLLAVALSPDGRTAYAAGYTGIYLGGKASVYAFDTASGKMSDSFPVHDDVHAITEMFLSPSGDEMGLLTSRQNDTHADPHLFVYRLSGGKASLKWHRPLSDLFTNTGEHLLLGTNSNVAPVFDNQNRLWFIFDRSDGPFTRVLAAFDGEGKTAFMKTLSLANGYSGGDLHEGVPDALAIHPDGSRVAIGYQCWDHSCRSQEARLASQSIDVISTRDGQVSQRIAWPESRFLLYDLKWHPDGNQLMLVADPVKDNNSNVHLQSVFLQFDGQDGHTIRQVTTSGFTEIFFTPDKKPLLVGKTRLAVLNNQGEVRHEVTLNTSHALSGHLGKTNNLSEMALSLEGHTLELRMSRPWKERWGQGVETFRVSLEDRSFSYVKSDDSRLDLPRYVFGLDEMYRHCAGTWGVPTAVTSDGEYCLNTSSDWNLIGLTRPGEATPRWTSPAPAHLLAINASGDGRYLVAYFNDGTFRWYRMQDGKEVFGLFVDAKSGEWILFSPSGYYDSSPMGDEVLGWLLNRDQAREAEFFSARHFERILFRPDYIRALIASGGDVTVARQTLGQNVFHIEELPSIAPPRVTLDEGLLTRHVRGPRTRIRFSAEKRALPMQEVAVFVNHLPVTPWEKRRLSEAKQSRFQMEMEIPLVEGNNHVQVEVGTEAAMGVGETLIIRDDTPSSPEKGDLYLLAIGSSTFPHMPEANLDFAALDADELALLLPRVGAKLYRKVHVKVLSDNAAQLPTRDNITSSLAFLKQAKPEDTVLLFLASHGVSDQSGDYFFVPRDGKMVDVAGMARSGRGGDPGSLLSWEPFFETMRQTLGKRLLVVDTCQARSISGTLDLHSLAKRSLSSHFALLSASKGSEESQEYQQGRHGLFTFALLQGLKGEGDGNRDGLVTLKELFTHAHDFVQTHRENPDAPQTPQLDTPSTLETMGLSQP